MSVKPKVALPIVGLCVGIALGVFVADWRHDRRASESLRKNYTDRARICLQAAALLRSKQDQLALEFLEQRALDGIRGVPMGRAYEELLPESQALLVTAKLYDQAFDEVDFKIDQLTRGEVPEDHPQLTSALRTATGRFGG